MDTTKVRGGKSAPLFHLPVWDFDQEDVAETYEDLMEELGEVAESYDRELRDTGLEMRKNGAYDGVARHVSTVEGAEDAIKDGYRLPAGWAHGNEIYTNDGQIEGEFEYEFQTSYRGALIPGNVNVELFLGPDVSPSEAEDLQDAVDRVL